MDEVQYTLTRNDFWQLQLYAISRQKRKLLLIIILLVCLFILPDRLFPGDRSLSLFFFTLFFAVTVLIVILIFSILFLMWRAASRSNETLGKKGVHVITISEQGTQQRNEINNGTSSWRAYKAIEEDKHNIYFVTDQPGRGFMSILIPKRAFESPSQAEHFVARARDYWR